jgi:hypothetical protein
MAIIVEVSNPIKRRERGKRMEKVISEFLRNNTDWILILGLLVLLVCTIIQLHKIKKMNRRIDSVVKSVENYLSVIMKDEERAGEEAPAKSGLAPEYFVPNDAKKEKQEEQSRLVSAVLQEIFP